MGKMTTKGTGQPLIEEAVRRNTIDSQTFTDYRPVAIFSTLVLEGGLFCVQDHFAPDQDSHFHL
jgi:hypothetical protein